MANINVTEAEYRVLFMAANAAQENGETAHAQVLDRLARKANAALTTEGTPIVQGFSKRRRLSWRDMPSTLKGAQS